MLVCYIRLVFAACFSVNFLWLFQLFYGADVDWTIVCCVL